MSETTIFIITNTSFNNRDKERFGVNFFLKKGLKVVVLDVQDYTNPELKGIQKPIYKNEKNLSVIQCKLFSNIKKVVHCNLTSNSFALLFLDQSIQSTKIRRYLRKNKIKIGPLNGGMLPRIDLKNKNNIILKIIKKFKSLNSFDFLVLMINRIYTNLFDVKYYDFLITSNYETSIENYNVSKSLHIIETHCLDYDLKIKYQNCIKLLSEKYVVFMDQYLLNHTDFIRSSNSLIIDKDKYYSELNQLFSSIEKKMKFEVVIAAHPRADVSEYKKLFEGRQIFVGETPLLVRDCEYCITHYSTAINFAVIYSKPILFITNNDLNKSFIYEIIEYFSYFLNQRLLNISNLKEVPQIQKINEESYQNYKTKYIKKSNTPEKTTWEFFYDEYIEKELNART